MMTPAEVSAALDAEMGDKPAAKFVTLTDRAEAGPALSTVGELDPLPLVGGTVKDGVYVPDGYEAPAPTPPSAVTEVKAFPFDAALPNAPVIERLFPERQRFADVAAEWASLIAVEAHHDFEVSSTTLRMRSADGALSRGKPGGLAYTSHGFGQLISLLLTQKPANLAGCLRWLRPERRAAAFNADVMPRTTRKADDLMVLRTYAAPRPGTNGERVRAVRAAVSLRHARSACDDLNLMKALRAELGPDAKAACNRSVDMTYGVAVVGTTAKHLHRTLHWSNSETGCASLAFTAGAVITFVDALVRLDGTRDEVSVTLEDEDTRSTMRHTAPGAKQSAERQQEIARERMQTKIREVLTAGEAVEGMWEAALVGFPQIPGSDAAAALVTLPAEQAYEVLADLLEERGEFKKEGDREAFVTMLKDEKRLEQLPRGSAAHVTAAFAVMGRRAQNDEASRHFQSLAGKWLARGWGNAKR